MDAQNNSPIVVALCADAAQQITGQVFLVQGGAVNVLKGWGNGELFFSENGWEPDSLLDQLLQRYPEVVAPTGMIESMTPAGGRSIRTREPGRPSQPRPPRRRPASVTATTRQCPSTGSGSDPASCSRARLAVGLSERGIAPGDRVVVTMENSPDVLVVYDAVFRGGAGVIVPVIFLLTADELRRIVSDSGAVAVVTSPALRQTVDAATAGLNLGAPRRASLGAELEGLAAGEPGPIAGRGDDDLAALVYTGGTTGRSKGVMLSHANLWEAGHKGQAVHYVPGLRRSLVCLPLSHS